MKIAFYAPLKAPTHPVPSGDRRMARLLQAALRSRGHVVDLACALRSWDDGRRPGRQARLRDLGLRLADRLVARYSAAERPDLWFTYHLYHKAPDWLGPRVSAALGIPYVVAEASHAPKRATGPWALGHAAARDAIRAADAVIALSSADLACLEPLVAVPEGPVRLRPFVETSPLAHAAERRPDHRAALAAAYDLPMDDPWLLAVGMMRAGDKARSYAVLAEALGRLRGMGWRLLIAGDGPHADAVRRLFDPIPADRIRWLGHLDFDRLSACYAAADLLVWPAINEAYGMALLEAQAAGLPVIAGASGGVPDIVRDGVTGTLTPPGDGTAFAGAVAALIADPERRASMARAALDITDRDHGFEAAAARIDAVLRAAKERHG